MCSILCAYAAKLLYIFIGDRRIKVQITDRTVGMSVALDTGSDLTFFHKDVYDQVLYAVSSFNILNHLPLLFH